MPWLCTENHFKDITHTVRLDLLEHHGGIVYAFRTVGDFFESSFFFNCRFEAQGAAGVFKKLALSSKIVFVDIVKAIFDLGLQCRVEQDLLISDLHVSLCLL